MIPSSSESTGPGAVRHHQLGVTAMPVRLNCPGCQATYTLPDHMAGQQVRCKQCQMVFRVGKPKPKLVEEPLDAIIIDDDPASEADQGVQSRPERVPPPPPPRTSRPDSPGGPRGPRNGNTKAPPSRPGPKKKGSSAPLIIGIVLVVLLLFCGLPVITVGGLIWYYA